MDTSQRLVLITGPAGRIGSRVRPYLRAKFRLRLMCHRTRLEPEEGEEVVTGDVLDLDSVAAAVDGAEAVIHLAACSPWQATWEEVKRLNLDGTYNVFEAARRKGIRKVVFASSNHVTGGYEKDGVFTTPDLPVRPDGFYGASKAFGEALARYYSDQFGMSIPCLRIGSFRPVPGSLRELATWLSPRDCAHLFARCLETEVPFGIFYGISRNTRRYWDISSAESVLGYQPEDDGEVYADRV